MEYSEDPKSDPLKTRTFWKPVLKIQYLYIGSGFWIPFQKLRAKMYSFCSFQDPKSGIWVLILDPIWKTDLPPMSGIRILTVYHKCKIFKCEQSFFKVGHNFRFRAQKKKAQRVEKSFSFEFCWKRGAKNFETFFVNFCWNKKSLFWG